MVRHRTTARALLPLVFAALAGSTGVAWASDKPPEVGGKAPDPGIPAPSPAPVPPATPAPTGFRIVFPVVGKATYTDDYGDPRGSHRHQGNDIMAPRRTVAVAAEAGRVSFYTTSARAGCMLYLYGRSGTKYLYVHLNNDLTAGNDNTGRCVPGVAYPKGLKSGANVVAGQPVGLVGDSGDANGGAPHLHFELHPKGRDDVNPYPHLRRAHRLLFPVLPGRPFTAALRGKVFQAAEGALTMKVDQVRAWPGSVVVPTAGRKVALSVPASTVITDPLGALMATARLQTLTPGRGAVAWTIKATATLKAALGRPYALATERLVLSK
jgi:Peptidase family M23